MYYFRNSALGRPLLALVVLLGALLIPASGSTQIPGLNNAVDHAFDRFNDAIESAKRAALAVEYQANIDARDRFDQIDTIANHTLDHARQVAKELVGDVNADVERALDQGTASLLMLEQTFMRDLLKSIDALECAATRTLNQSLPESLGSIRRFLGANSIEITAPLLYVGEAQGFFCNDDLCRLKKTSDIVQPYATTYRAIRTYLLDRLDHARDDTPRYTVVISYTMIAEIAKKTTCFVQGAEKDYLDDYSYYINKARAWDIVPETRR